ncbi:MAG: hypothetical protein QF473_07250, partial [Planctomycetota bacterium]|nr:hypothetical protein [Planctomycetota bacterium]
MSDRCWMLDAQHRVSLAPTAPTSDRLTSIQSSIQSGLRAETALTAYSLLITYYASGHLERIPPHCAQEWAGRELIQLGAHPLLHVGEHNAQAIV